MQSASHMTSYLESSLDDLDDDREEDGESISECKKSETIVYLHSILRKHRRY